MGGASGSEGDFAPLLDSFFDGDEQEGSLSHILTPAKRPRSKNWNSVERKRHLEAMLEAERGLVKGKKWEYISQRLREGSGRKFLRTAKDCENFWGTLRKKYRAIERHEILVGAGPQTSVQYPRTVSYFKMDEESRSRHKFLPLPCYELMRNILLEQKNKKDERQQSTDHAQRPHVVHSVLDHDTQLSRQHPSLESSVVEQSEIAVNSCFESLRCRFSRVDSQKLSRLLAPDIMEQVKAIVVAKAILNVRLAASIGYRFDVDDPVTELTPHVAKFIKNALESAIAPVSSQLEGLAEIQKKRQEILDRRRAIERDEEELEESERRLVGSQ